VPSPGLAPLSSPAFTVRRNTPGIESSAKILPVACVGLGGALLSRASGAAGAEKVVLGSTGLLSIFNLAPTDSARYASGKRAVKIYEGRDSLPYGAQAAAALASKWYKLVQARQLGQLVGLLMMLDSRFSVLTGAAVFMGANVGFLALGSGEAKHDDEGLPTPMKPGLYKVSLAHSWAPTRAVATPSLPPPPPLEEFAIATRVRPDCLSLSRFSRSTTTSCLAAPHSLCLAPTWFCSRLALPG
jgi:hypothetical protein